MNRRLSQVALSAAAALTLSLAAPVAANASESTDATAVRSFAPTAAAPQAKASARPTAAAPVTVGALQLRRAYAWEHRVNWSKEIATDLSVAYTVHPDFRINTATADLYVNGRARGAVKIPWYSTNTGFIQWSRTYGPGKTQLRNVRLTGWFRGSAPVTRSYVLPVASNTIAVKRARESASGFYMTKRGSKIKLKITGYRTYANNGRLVPAGKALVQRKVGKKWRTVKRVSIRKSGKTNVAFKHKKKFRYRVLIKGTSTVDGINYITRGKI